MAKPVYIANNFGDIDELQRKIMLYIDAYCHNAKNKKKPIQHRTVLNGMTEQNIKESTTVNALISLQKKGYIRRAVASSNKTSYIQLRRV